MSAPESEIAKEDEPTYSTKIPKGQRGVVAAWAMWDWGASAYNTIVISFVFAPYLTNVVAKNAPPESLPGATWLSL